MHHAAPAKRRVRIVAIEGVSQLFVDGKAIIWATDIRWLKRFAVAVRGALAKQTV